MKLGRYVLYVAFAAAAWTFVAVVAIATYADARVALGWALRWLYALPAMLLVSSASAFSYLAYRNAPTSRRSAGIFVGAALFSGAVGLALTELLVGQLGR